MANRDRLRGGEVNAALTDELVGIQTGYLGRGPMAAFTFHRGDVVVTLMHDILTKAEKVLAQTGGRSKVTDAHGLFRQQMEGDFRAVVERLTGQKVLAVLGANHIDPDVAASRRAFAVIEQRSGERQHSLAFSEPSAAQRSS
jgi:uncharacterized protein YbcI